MESCDLGKTLEPRQRQRLETIRTICELLMRGKACSPVEFGTKLYISVVDGGTRLEYRSFDTYSEAENLREIVEHYVAREKHYPKRILADRIYRKLENLNFCREHGIQLSGSTLSHPKKDAVKDSRQDYLDECERVDVERAFSLAKRKCDMGLITARQRETTAHVIAMSVLVMNPRRIQLAFSAFLSFLLAFFQSLRKFVIVR